MEAGDMLEAAFEPSVQVAPPLARSLGGLGIGLSMVQTTLDAVETWSHSLHATLGISLSTRFPIAIYWGPQLALLYNDAWSPIRTSLSRCCSSLVLGVSPRRPVDESYRSFLRLVVRQIAIFDRERAPTRKRRPRRVSHHQHARADDARVALVAGSSDTWQSPSSRRSSWRPRCSLSHVLQVPVRHAAWGLQQVVACDPPPARLATSSATLVVLAPASGAATRAPSRWPGPSIRTCRSAPCSRDTQ
jgi:hypothetical protein